MSRGRSNANSIVALLLRLAYPWRITRLGRDVICGWASIPPWINAAATSNWRAARGTRIPPHCRPDIVNAYFAMRTVIYRGPRV